MMNLLTQPKDNGKTETHNHEKDYNTIIQFVVSKVL